MITMRNITKSYQMGENVVHALRGLPDYPRFAVNY